MQKAHERYAEHCDNNRNNAIKIIGLVPHVGLLNAVSFIIIFFLLSSSRYKCFYVYHNKTLQPVFTNISMFTGKCCRNNTRQQLSRTYACVILWFPGGLGETNYSIYLFIHPRPRIRRLARHYYYYIYRFSPYAYFLLYFFSVTIFRSCVFRLFYEATKLPPHPKVPPTTPDKFRV